MGDRKMADLPTDRMEEHPPFLLVVFGPFMVNNKRAELKRYGALFTCLSSRAIHIETLNNMDTDSFILALRRFIGRRGNVRLMRSDNGSNFVGCRKEMKKALMEIDQTKVKGFLQSKGSDWITWHHNPPSASHMGGIWERQIRSARAILVSLLKTHGRSLDDESLTTLLIETEAIVNSRPLTTETLGDVTSVQPISPTNLLTMKSKVVLPPPGNFVKNDMYCRKRWRRVQHIANEFWNRWRKE